MMSFRCLHAARVGVKVRWQGGVLKHATGVHLEWVKGAGAIGSSLSPRLMSSQPQYETLKVTCEDGLRVITFNRPEKKNAISETMFEETIAALKEAANDPNTLVTATTGAGNVYTAGNDKLNFLKMTVPDIADLLVRYFASFIDFPKPLVAVVNGAAVGAGTTLLPLYDAVFATERAIFFTPFSSLGIVAEGTSTYTFPILMGHVKAAEILLFEKRLTAADACERGLVTEVFPDKTFQEQVWPRVQAMTKLPHKSLVYSKQLCREVHRDNLYKANINECNRVSERLSSVMFPDREDYKKFAASLPPFPASAKI